MRYIGNLILLLVLGLSTALTSVLLYVRYLWPDFSFEQFLNTVRELSPDVISANTFTHDYIGAALFFIIVFPLCYLYLTPKFQALMIPVNLLISGVLVEFPEYVYYQNTSSDLMENHYIIPNEKEIVFPEKKRNLILIYLESFEQNFAKAEHYGANLIPNLEKLQQSGEYSPNHTSLRGTDYSIAALVSSLCGLPLRLLPDRDIYANKFFLPQAVCVPEILEHQGYQTELLKAADITFTRADIFAKAHGFQQALGVDEILAEYPPEAHEKMMGTFGGINDETLLEQAKKVLAAFSPEKPFMLTLFSLDTHSPASYHNPKCPIVFNDIQDVFSCTDKTVYDFVKWFNASPYYENTTLIILGDHLLSTRLKTKGKPKRGVYNVFLNLPEGLHISSDKTFSSFDFAPTILESLGVQLPKHTFGLGRSLFGDVPPLLESLGRDTLNLRIQQQSDIYTKLNTPLVQRVESYSPYRLNTELGKKELLPYTDSYEEFLDEYYLDRLNFLISPTSDQDLTVTLSFKAIMGFNTKIAIYANHELVHTFTQKTTDTSAKTVTFTVPNRLLTDNKLQLSFRNNAGIESAMQMGIAPQHLIIK
jgi:phosphoglycerol transferase